MEWESDSPCHSHTYPGQEPWPPGRGSSWELEFGECGVIPGRGLLLTVERRIERMWGRRSWWEMPVEESQAAMEAGWYCWVMCRGWSHHHICSLFPYASISSWTIERLAHQTPDTLNYRVGPRSAGCPSMCMMHRTTEKDPRQGSPLSAWTVGAMEKNQPKRPSDHQLTETLVGPHLLWLRQSVSLNTWCQCCCDPSSCTTFMLNPHWGRVSTDKKKVLHLGMRCHFSCVQLFVTLWTVAAMLLCQGVL